MRPGQGVWRVTDLVRAAFRREVRRVAASGWALATADAGAAAFPLSSRSEACSTTPMLYPSKRASSSTAYSDGVRSTPSTRRLPLPAPTSPRPLLPTLSFSSSSPSSATGPTGKRAARREGWIYPTLDSASASGVAATNRYRNGGRRTCACEKSHDTCTSTQSSMPTRNGWGGVTSSTDGGGVTVTSPRCRSHSTRAIGNGCFNAASICSASSTASRPIAAREVARCLAAADARPVALTPCEKAAGGISVVPCVSAMNRGPRKPYFGRNTSKPFWRTLKASSSIVLQPFE